MAESNREEIAKLEALYANNPGGRVFTHLAEAYRKAGELERARQILEDGITRHAEYASAHVVLGRVLQDQGARVDASAAFRRVLELDPENRVALRSLGDLAREGNDRAEALAYFRQLLSLDPTDDQLVRIIDQLNTAVHAAEAEAEAEPPSLDEIAPQSPEVNPGTAGTHEPEIAASAGHHFSRTEELTDSEAKAADAAETSDPDASQSFVVESFAPASNDDLEDYVTPDIRLDWDSEGVPHGESPALPGDLAAFAQADATEGATEAEPSTFASEAAAESETTGEDTERGTSEAESEAAPAESATWAAIETTPAWADAAATESAPTAEADPAEAFEAAPASEEETARFEQPDSIELSEPDAVVPEPVAEVFEEATLEVSEFVDLGEEPLKTEHEPTFEELLSSSRAEGWESQQAAEPTSLQSELQTETLAELYLRQGFNDRAAEVYRSLLERNPGDERLRRRLEEVEAQLTEERAAGGFAAAESSWHDHEDSAPDTFWTGGGEDASFEPTLYAWSPDAEAEEPKGPTIGSYFSDLLGWRPSGRNGSVAVESTATLSSAAEDVSKFVEAAPAAKEGGDPATAMEEVPPEVGGPGESAFEEVEAPKDRDTFVAQEFASAPESAAAEVSTEPDSSAAPEHAAPEPQAAPEAAAEASFAPTTPESASVPTAPPSAMLSQFSAPLNEVEAAFEEWFSGAPPQRASAAPATEPEKAAAPAAPEPVASATPAETRPPAPPSSEESEDDEDLEMFRSWLQSLKR